MIEVSIYYPTTRYKVDKNGNQLEPVNDKVRIEFILPKRPLLFWADYHLGQRLAFPKGYGVAWYDQATAQVLYAPIPLNVIIGFLIWSSQWLRLGGAVWFWRHKKKRVVRNIR